MIPWCFLYFHQILRAPCPNRTFLIPDWTTRLATPTIKYSTSPPTYREITNNIRKMKTSGLSCPLDQISIIAFKLSSYQRTYLNEITSQAWKAKTTPDTWENAVTNLIHTKTYKGRSILFSPSYTQMYNFKGYPNRDEKLKTPYIYSGFKASVTTTSYSSPFIPIGRGGLQVHWLSPLLFNMIFNTCITSVKSKEFEQLGYRYFQNLSPRYWYQFADDAAIATGQQYENQVVLNAFTRWIKQANMIIRADKCKTFGIQKVNT